MILRQLFGQNKRSRLTAALLILNLLALLFYFLVTLGTGQLAEVEQHMYATSDARGYRDVADWQLGRKEEPPPAASYRPFLYPLLLAGLRYFTANAYAVWMVQFVFWLMAVNLTSLSVFGLTKRLPLFIISFLIFAFNGSAIVETFHALTEITTLFLLALWVYLFAHDRPAFSSTVRIALLTLLMALLVVVKPVFQIHLLLIVVFAVTRIIRQPKSAPLMLLALVPVFAQLAIMVDLIGVPKLSTISERTLNNYFSSELYALAQNTSFEESRLVVAEYDGEQHLELLRQNPGSALILYAGNVMFQNLLQGSDLLGEHETLRSFTSVTNAVYYGLHLVFLPLTILVIARKRDKALKIAVLYAISVLIIASSGISFWQGDRLVLFALPAWLVAYSSVVHRLILERERRTQ